MQIKSVFFDLDGTLVDTEMAATNVVLECFAEWNIPAKIEDASIVAGTTWEAALNYFFKKYPFPISQEEAMNVMLTKYREVLNREVIEVPGSRAAVASIATKYPLALVSGSHRQEIIFLLKKLGIYQHFQFILGCEDYSQSKPSPEGYLLGFEKMKVSPQEVLIFEDSAPGVAAARAAGAWVVAVTGTNHFQHKLTDAHGHVENLKDITAGWVQKFQPAPV